MSALLESALELARVGIDAAQGKPDPLAIAKAMVGLGEELALPVEELRRYLDAAAVARAEAEADAIENARFPRGGTP